MEKIKNLISGNKNQDEENLYGGSSTGAATKGTLSGEGSHLGSSLDSPSGGGPHSTLPGTFPSAGAAEASSGVPTSTLTGTIPSAGASEASTDQTGHALPSNAGVGAKGGVLTGSGTYADPSIPSSSTLDSTQTSGLPSSNTTALGSNTTGQHGNNSTATTAARSAAGFGGEGAHLQRENELHPAANTGYPGMTQGSRQVGSGYDTTSRGTSSSGQHLGRDVAALGAGGVAGSDLAHREKPREFPLGTATIQGTSTGNNSGLTQGTNISSTHHLGRDAAALGTAGAVGAGVHHHSENERDLASGTGISGNQSSGTRGLHHTGGNIGDISGPHTTTTANRLDPNVNPGGSLEHGIVHSHKHGGGAESADKDHAGAGKPVIAGFGSSGAHAAEQERQKHQIDRDNLEASNSGVGHGTTGSSGSHLGRDAAIGTGAGLGAAGLAGHEHNKHQNTTQSTSGVGSGTTSNMGTSSTTSGSHLGRDAAIGTGAGLGAAGLAQHEHNKHKDATQSRSGGASGTTSGLGSSSTGSGPAPTTAGPHSKDWMNKLDPRYDSNPGTAVTGYAPGQTGSSTTSTGNTGATTARSGDVDQSKHHYGRDAAVAGGVGGAALAADRHHDQTRHGDSTATSTGNTGAVTSRPGGIDPDHHLGRDAAVAGGVGGAGLAYNHHQKEQQANRLSEASAPAITGQPAQTAIPTDSTSHASNVASREPTTDSGKDHHYGRDAAVAGGVGGAAYEADKHHKKDEVKKEHHKEEKSTHHTNKDEKEKKGGLFSFIHRDKSKKYTPAEEEEFDRQEREHNSHTARNTALGGAAVGAGAYEANKHHNEHSNAQNSTTSHTGAVGGPSGEKYISEASMDQDGNLLPGADTNFDGQPLSHSHGGQVDQQGKYDDGKLTDTKHHSGAKTGTAALAAGAGATAVGAESRHHDQQTGTTTGSSSNNPLGVTPSHGEEGSLGTHTSHQIANHGHMGHSKTDSGVGMTSPTTGSGSDSTTISPAALSGNKTTHDQAGHQTTPKDTGVAKGEEKHHHWVSDAKTSGPTTTAGPGLSGNTNFSTTGQSLTGEHLTGEPETKGRNRLHRDPPAGHPAAQGASENTGTVGKSVIGSTGTGYDGNQTSRETGHHTNTSSSGLGDSGDYSKGVGHNTSSSGVSGGNETKRMIQEGKQDIEGDTGVANSQVGEDTY